MSPLTLDAKRERISHAATGTGPSVSTRAPASEYAGPHTRFRVITRRPLPPPYRLRRAAPRNPVKRALAIAGVPALMLVTYVALWTGAMHGGYYQQRISDQIKSLQIENDMLQANLRKLQSPRRILELAKGLQMKPADAVEFVNAPDNRHHPGTPSRAAAPPTAVAAAPELKR